MADNNKDKQSDVISSDEQSSKQPIFNYDNSRELLYLMSIDENVKRLVRNGQVVSQSNARAAGNPYEDSQFSFRRMKGLYTERRQIGGFADEFEKVLLESVLGSDFKEKIGKAVSTFADSLGAEARDIPGTIGRHLGNAAVSLFKTTDIGKTFYGKVEELKKSALSNLKDTFEAGYKETTGKKSPWSAAREASRSNAKDSTEKVENPESSKSNESNTSEVVKSTDFTDLNLDELRNIADIFKSSFSENISGFKDKLSGVFKKSKKENVESSDDADVKHNASKKSSSFIQDVKSKLQDVGTSFKDKLSGKLKDKAASYVKDAGLNNTIGPEMIGNLSKLSQGAANASTVLSGSLGGAAKVAGSVLGKLGPYGLAAVAAIGAFTVAADLAKKALKYAFGPALESASAALKEAAKVANRREVSRQENRKLANDRYQKDIRSIVEEPFKILEQAAEKVEQAWDANLRKINATQGYSKADLQALMATYADRLREDNLSAVVSGSDIINNLSSVLDQGLSGEVANEFAYLATVLNAAIPTQDFFGYAGTYSAIAANAIKDGKSQSEAIKYANSQLESFASSVLYASRELSGGFSTGLKNAQSLFDDSFKIAQASRTGVPSEIAGVLTSVAAIVGSIAPDLSTSITDAVTKAATGGNSPDVVALRSLAGINASNTEFLKALANNPQQVFSDLFTNLANMFNDTDDAWMEKAEAYSQVFGLSMDAFARIDFSYLADAVSRMKVDNSALIQNFDQLISGETTTNKELLRMQQANKYMIEEGLAYVLDNEAARLIQQHMWDEQIARNIMENEYAVNLKGKALDFLDSLRTTVERIMNILNPIKWLAKSVTNIAGTIAENYGQDEDIKRILEAGKVGTGNPRDLYNLTHRNQDLQLTPNYAELLTGESAFRTMSGIRSTVDNLLHITDSVANPLGVLNTIATASDVAKWTARETNQISSAVMNASKSVVRSIQSATSTFNSSRSVYDWEVVSKSAAKDLSKTANYLAKSNYTAYTASTVYSSPQEQNDLYADRYKNLIDVAQKSIGSMYDDAGKYVYDDSINDMLKYKTYDEWEHAILKKVNIRNMNDFLDYGMDETTVAQVQKELKEAYENAQTSAGGQEQNAEREDQRLLRKEQRQFWEDHRAFWDETRAFRDETRAFWQETRDFWDETRVFRDETRAFWQETRDEWTRVEEYRIYEKDFRARQEQFWIDAKTAWKADYDQDTLYYDLILQRLGEDGPIYLKLKDFMAEWVKYFVLHQAYRDAYDSSDVEKIQREEKGEASTAVYRLAEALTNNDTELLDPVMQTNALLSQILLVAQAIMQQNNSTTGGNTSLFSSLQATALGLVNTE